MFHPFQVEQFLSDYEQGVTYNFSESGVHPLTLGGLLDLAGTSVETLSGVALDYPEVRGTERLRARIAALYPGAEADNVLVTVGASEANHLIAATLLEPGDEMVALSPTYQQLPGNALNAGITVKTVPLVEEEGWALDTGALARAVGPKTRLIAIVNPNNPTGHILSEAEMAAVVAAAARSGAWIVADEVYAGTERGGDRRHRGGGVRRRSGVRGGLSPRTSCHPRLRVLSRGNDSGQCGASASRAFPGIQKTTRSVAVVPKAEISIPKYAVPEPPTWQIAMPAGGSRPLQQEPIFDCLLCRVDSLVEDR